MAFTGTPVQVVVAANLIRITGLSLLAGASGTISMPEGTGAVKLPAQFDADPYAIFGHDVGLNESISIDIESTAGSGGAVGANIAHFFGTTTGTGSAGNDYAATVAVQTTAGTGRVPFPRNGPSVGTVVTRNASDVGQFLVSTAGVYRASWAVDFAEASQLTIAVNDVLVANTTQTSGAGTQENVKTVLLTLAANDKVSLVNPAGNAAALTIQPADGELTHAQAPSFVLEFVAGAAEANPPISVAKTGASKADFLATITNSSAAASAPLEIYVRFHT